MKNRFLHVLLALTLLFVFPFGSHATQFDNLIVFGDSLSDNGNVLRFTDGDIWVETLADSLGADLWDYAYGGATTGFVNPKASEFGLGHTGLLWQVDNYDAPMENALFTVWAGANDFLNALDFYAAAANVGTALDNLYLDGARDILVGNLPDMGTTPALIADPTSGLASDWTVAFNYYLKQELLGFESDHADVNLYILDAYSVFCRVHSGNSGLVGSVLV